MKIEVKQEFDKGIPIPVMNRRIASPLHSMKVGDSFKFDKELRNNYQSSASRIKRDSGKEYTIQVTTDDACRIWRIK